MWAFATDFFTYYAFRTHLCVTCIISILLLLNKIPLHRYITFYLFIHQLVQNCFHFLTIIKQCCYKNSCTSFCVDMFYFPLVYIQEWIAGTHSNFTLNILRKCQMTSFHILISMYEGSNFFTSPSTHVAGNLLCSNNLYIILVDTIKITW